MDLAAWEGGYGTAAGATKAMGDFDNDGRILGVDFLGWQANVGAAAQAAAAAIPEPASLVLLVAGLGSFVAGRRSSHV